MEETAVVKRDQEMSLEQVKGHVALVQRVMREVMREEEHYGTIPGTKKPSLYKSGAEKLGLTFRLSPTYEVRKTDMPGGHREYEVVCTLTHIPTGQVFGQGVGACSTMEAKYRYRTGNVEFTGRPVPQEYWDNRDNKLLGGSGFSAKKNPDTGKWEIVRQGERVEHDNPADHYNTVLKMAKKRGHIDATLTATAASDIFSQDIEDLEQEPGKNPSGKSQNADSDPKKRGRTKGGAAKGSVEKGRAAIVSILRQRMNVSPDDESFAAWLQRTVAKRKVEDLDYDQCKTVYQELQKLDPEDPWVWGAPAEGTGSDTIACPDGGEVDRSYCQEHCENRQGCPSWE